MANKKILVDPMLSDIGTLPPIPLTPRRTNNPLISLPLEKTSLIKDIDAVLLTHYHFDHFDKVAENILPKNILVFCQPVDEAKLNKKGFINVQVIDNNIEWGKISIKRFPANHAEEFLLKKALGKSSSYFLQTESDSLFITGDAILDQLLVNSLEKIKPNSIIVYSGSAQFLFGKPITLTYNSLKRIRLLLPEAKIMAVHLDAINHCLLSKDELRKSIIRDNLTMDIIIPNEGDMLSIVAGTSPDN
jgi:L-ascorbate metabolism protein UlaG (beta-lactamase superfamily)